MFFSASRELRIKAAPRCLASCQSILLKALLLFIARPQGLFQRPATVAGLPQCVPSCRSQVPNFRGVFFRCCGFWTQVGIIVRSHAECLNAARGFVPTAYVDIENARAGLVGLIVCYRLRAYVELWRNSANLFSPTPHANTHLVFSYFVCEATKLFDMVFEGPARI